MLLLTGMPGIGKTTVIRKAAILLEGRRLGGFYTEEIREQGQRLGFRLVTFNGLQKIIAHVEFSAIHRVGKYGVDIAAIDESARIALALNEDTDLYLVDEIGKMECLSSGFIAAMRNLFKTDKPLVATIGKKGGGFIEEVKQRPDALIWEVTHKNRDVLPNRIVDWLG